MRRLYFLYHDHVLDAHAELAVFVVARLVGEDVARSERYFGVLSAGADADGAFVDIEIGTDTVAGAMAVVKSVFLCLC